MMATRESQQPAASLPLALAATAVGVLAGYLIKYQCATHPWDGFQYTHFCYNEIQALFGVRGIGEGLIPYVDTRFEYPVLTGMFMYAAGWLLRLLAGAGVLANDTAGYLVVSSALLAPLVFAVTLLLRPRVTRNRLLIWAIGAPTVLYAFHNWDLLAAAGAVWGLVSLETARHGRAGSALALGASAKLFPGFLMAPGVLSCWARGDRRAAKRLVVAFVGLYALVNVPWILASGGAPRIDPAAVPGVELRAPGINGWIQVWTFHAGRYPDYWTVWYWIAKYGRIVWPGSWWDIGSAGYRDFVNLASFLLFGVGALWLLWRGWRRRGEQQGYPVAAIGLAIIALFLLTSKVYSPQYALWTAPLLAMLTIPWRYVLYYLGAEVAVLVAGFMWFTQISQPDPPWLGALEAFVWFRAFTLVLLLTGCLKASRLYPAPERTPAGASEPPVEAAA